MQILHFIADGSIVPVYSDEIVQEYDEVLHRDKFKLPENIIKNLLDDITKHGLRVSEIAAVEEKMRDPKDVVFYAVTLSSQDKNSLLVTGNGKHFPQKPFIVTPAELVAILRGKK